MRQPSSESTCKSSKVKPATDRPMLLVEPETITAPESKSTGRSRSELRQLASGSQLSSDSNYAIDHLRYSSMSDKQLSSDSPSANAMNPHPHPHPNSYHHHQHQHRRRLEDQTKRQKKMRNDKLTSMLVILFGTLLLASSGAGSEQPSTKGTTEASGAIGQLPGAIANTTTPASESPSKDSGLLDGSDSSDEGANEDSRADTPLGSLIVDVASDAVEKILVEGSREDPSESTGSGSEETAHEDGALGGSGADSERLPAAAPATAPEVRNSSAQLADQEELGEALEVYKRWRATGDDIFELFSRKVLPVIMQHGYDLDGVSMANLLQVFNAIRGQKAWALKLLDASAKLTPGVLVGTQSDFGDFDECLNVRVDNPSGLNEDDIGRGEPDPLTGLSPSTVVGKYCIADLEFPKPPRIRLAERDQELGSDFAPIQLRRPLLNFSETSDFKDTIFVETANFFHMLYVDPLRVGICLTNKIDPDGFANIVNKLAKDFRVTIDFKARCVTKYDRLTWSTQQVISAYVLVCACSLVMLSTLLDLLHMKLNKLPLPASLDARRLTFRSSILRYEPIFTSFSILRNTKRLFKQAQRPDPHRGGSVSSAELAKSLTLLPTSGSLGVASLHESCSLESSPSIERRSSLASSAINLISEHQQQLAIKAQLASFVAAAQQRDQLDRRQVNLQCLHGIRVITMTWMIVNHTYLFGGFFVLWAHRRLIDIAEWPKSLSFQLVLNGWLTVETYFFLSAAIIVLNVMPLMQSRKFTYFTYVLHRLIRLLPAYVGLVCLNFLWPLVSTGPVWLVKGRSFIQTPCENYLWTNFLFINNWIWPEKQCMVHTWFLSADFQLYLVAPIIVYLLYRRPVLGHSLNILVAVLASILSGFVIYANKLMPTTLINKLEFSSIKQQLSYSYFATYQHMGPYCLGIFIGYLMHKRPQVHLPKHLTWSLWLLLPPLSFTTLLLTYLWNGAYDEPNLINPSPIVSALYVAIHRTIWTSLLAWIVFACTTGRAKIMSSFLSNPIFIPLSRLSFSIYLVHLPVIMFRALNLRHTIEWTDANILWEACGNFIVSLLFGYFLNIFFESPIINLERVIFGRSPATEAGRRNVNLQEKCQKSSINEGSFVSKSDDSSDTATESSSNGSDNHKSASEARQHSPRAGNWRDPSCNAGSDSHQQPAKSLHTDLMKEADGEQRQSTAGRLSSISANLEHQLESLADTKTDLGPEAADSRRQVAPAHQKPQLSSPAEVDRYSLGMYADEARPAQESMLVTDRYLYQAPGSSPNNPLRQHPDRPYSALNHRWRESYLNQRPLSHRPMQYATLARTSRPSQDDNYWPLGGNLSDEFPSHFFDLPHKAHSHLGEPTSHRQLSMTGNQNRQRLAYLSHRQMQRQNQSRASRYNTYTTLSDNNMQISNRYLTPTSSSGDWLQPGALIPRIDSSTLKRKQKLTAPEVSPSIAEESNSLNEQELLP